MTWSIDLSGKTIIVTGGNRGIGLAITHQIAQAGANVAVVYRASTDATSKATQVAEKYGVKCVAYQCQVTDQEAVRALVQQVQNELGNVTGVVCNAGMIVSQPALEFTKADYDQQMDVNVWGCFTFAQAAARLWKETGHKQGRIVFVSSVAGSVAIPGVTNSLYAPSKGAVNILAKTLAMEWAELGILVNCVSPGFTDTDMNQDLRDDPAKKASVDKLIMLGRVGEPHEQAGMVVFFLSEYATYITGTEIRIDGGQTAW